MPSKAGSPDFLPTRTVVAARRPGKLSIARHAVIGVLPHVLPSEKGHQGTAQAAASGMANRSGGRFGLGLVLMM